MKLTIASNNKHKIDEINAIIANQISIGSLEEIGCLEDIPENGSTLEANAFLKSFYVYHHYNVNCFADDTGLEVDALNGKPGVFSARYAGEEKDPQKNIDKLLSELQGISNRKARFRTIISLILNGKEYQFEGVVNGKIAQSLTGSKGFGYDPIFIPDGYSISFAEMESTTKNQISHRYKAVKKLADFLNKNDF